MKKLMLLVLHELRLLLKDRQALGLLFVMPLAFIVFLTLALQDVYLAKVGQKVKLEFVTGTQCDDADSVCTKLLEELKRQKYDIQVSAKPSYTRSLTLILPEKIGHTLDIIKKGEKLEDGDKVQLVFDPTLDQSLRALVESNLSLALQSVMIVQVKAEIDKTKKDLKSKGATNVKIASVSDVNHVEGLIEEKAINGVILPNPIQQTVPAWALFGMFFIVIPMANSMIRDRKLGVFKRLLSFPVTRGQLIFGKILPFLILNFFQFAMMFAVGVFVLPRITHLNLVLDFSYAHIVYATLACAFAATSYGLMVACLARTSEQASAFGALSVVILAILGGVMIPRFVMPEFMQHASQISPLYWGLESYLDIIVRKAPFTETLKKIGVLVGFGVLCVLIASRRFRWADAE